MTVNNFNESTPSKSYPAGEIIDEWNFKKDAAANNPAVIDGKIVARMPDLGAAPSITDDYIRAANSTNGTHDDETGAVELFRRAFVAAWRGHFVGGGTCAVSAKRTNYTASSTLYRRVSAIGLCAVICGVGILFLDKKEPAENVAVTDIVSETVGERTLSPITDDSVLAKAAPSTVSPNTTTIELPVVVSPASEVAEHPATHVLPRPASVNDLVGSPWESGNYTAVTAAEPVNMYPITSNDNTPAVYPPAPSAEYSMYAAAERTTAAYPVPNNVQNYPPQNYPPQNTGANNSYLAVAPAPAANAGQQYGAFQNNPIPENRGNYLQSAGRVIPSPQYYQNNATPNNGYTGTPNPNAAFHNAAPQPQYPPNYASPQYQQPQPAYQAPQSNNVQQNYPYDYVPSHRKLY